MSINHTFTDAENIYAIVPPGDYVVQVVKIEQGVSKGAKTSGSEQIDLTLLVEQTGAHVWETLVFHPLIIWKIDTFLKSMNYLINGIPPAKGERLSFDSEDLVGLRGWASIVTEVYKEKPRSKISAWLTDKPKLEKVVNEDLFR